MTRISSLTLAAPLLVSLVCPVPSDAFSLADAKVLLHLATPVLSGGCSRPEAHPACRDVVTAGGLYPGNVYFAYLLVADADPVAGIAAVALGIDYDSGIADGVGVDLFGWFLCGTLELTSSSPSWPNPGSSNIILWDQSTRCQRNEPGGPGTGVVATAGYFTAPPIPPARCACGIIRGPSRRTSTTRSRWKTVMETWRPSTT